MDILEFEFMQNAIAAGLLTSIICGIMGTLVVVNRIVFLSGGIAHAAYGGIGMAFYFKWPVMPSTMGFSLIASLLMAAVTLKARHRADTIIGVIWALGMAFGIIMVDLTPGYNVEIIVVGKKFRFGLFFETCLVNGIRGIGNQFPYKYFFVGIKGMDDQVQ